MPDISENEARALLAKPLHCVDCGGWISSEEHPQTRWLRAGLIDEQGRPTGLMVEVRCRSIAGAKAESFRFTILRQGKHTADRVYQLEVNHTRKPLKDWHKRSHEHYGDIRSPWPEERRDWNYEQLLRYVCGRTNIDFQPSPPTPVQP